MRAFTFLDPTRARSIPPLFCAQSSPAAACCAARTPSTCRMPYTLRCVPQVHGAVRDAIAYSQWVINIELNSVNDNPIIFVDEQSGRMGCDLSW